MQLVIPGLADLPRTDVGGVARYELCPDATLDVHPLVELPAQLDGWGRDVVGADAHVLAVLEDKTELGWKVTIAASERAGEYRIHLLFEFLEYGGIAVVRAKTPAAYDQAFELVKPLVPFARPDFSGTVVALAQVWAGL